MVYAHNKIKYTLEFDSTNINCLNYLHTFDC